MSRNGRFGCILTLAVFFTVGLAGSAQALAMRKGPYLIYPGVNTQMQVLWQLDGTATCTLEWGLDTNYGTGSTQTTEYGSDHQHKYTIPDLSPGTKYFYRVTAGSAGQHTGSFRTAPSTGAMDVRMLAYGDTRTNPGDHDSVCEAAIDEYTSDPSCQTLMLLSGDWVNTGDSESDWDNQYFNRSYPNALQMQSELAINGCMGNHEGSGSVYVKYWPYPYQAARYWSFDYGPVHVVVVDQYADYSPGSAQLNWIASDLATTDQEWKIMLYHEPGWSAGGGHGNNTDVQNRLQPLCVQYGVDITIAGHNHYYCRCDVEGVHHITSGGGGAPQHTPDLGYPNVVTAEKSFHFCKIDIDDYDLTFTAYRTNGTVIDQFSVQHESPNLMVNPGAETGDFTGWNTGGYPSGQPMINPPTDVPSPPNHSGDYRFGLSVTSETANCYQYQTIVVDPGSMYTAGLSACHMNGTDEHVQMSWIDGAWPGTENVLYDIGPGSPGTTWVDYAGATFSPSDVAATIVLRYLHDAATGTASIHVDDIWAEYFPPTPTPTATPTSTPTPGAYLLNPSFEEAGGSLNGWTNNTSWGIDGLFPNPGGAVDGSHWASYSYGGGGTVMHEIYQNVAVSPGGTYRLSGYYNLGGTNGWAKGSLMWYDGTYTGSGGGTEIDSLTWSYGMGIIPWTQLSGDINPTGSTIGFIVRADISGWGGGVNVDLCNLVDISGPTNTPEPTDTPAATDTPAPTSTVTNTPLPTDTPTETPTPPSYYDDHASAETPVAGTVSGSYLDTHESDLVYESITERESGGKPDLRHSWLEHIWVFNVQGSNPATLYVKGYHSANSEGDDFLFSVSVDGGESYSPVLTLTKTSDDGEFDSGSLPAGVSGTVYVKVEDTDRSQGNRNLDTVYVDEMYIRSFGAGPTFTPTEVPTPEPTNTPAPTDTPGGGPYQDHASGETTILGTVTTGSYLDTLESDLVYEGITEEETEPAKPFKSVSMLEHIWTVNVQGGDPGTLYVKGYHTANSEGDDFAFSASVNGGQSYSPVLTLTKTVDDGQFDSGSLPSGVSGTVYIKVEDTDRSRGNNALDTVYVDELYVETN
jgi:hypothetical protein